MLALKIILWALAAIAVLLILILLFHLRIELCFGQKTGVYLRVLWMRFDVIRIVSFFTGRSKGKKSEIEDSSKTGETQKKEEDEKKPLPDLKSEQNYAKKTNAMQNSKENRQITINEKKSNVGGKNDEIPDIADIPNIPEIPGIPEDKLEKIKFMAEFVYGVVKNVWGYLGIKIRKLHVCVATGDAAKTAEVYGVVCAALTGFFAFIDNFKRVKVSGRDAIDIRADFLGEEIFADVSVELSFYVWQLAHIALAALFKWMGM